MWEIIGEDSRDGGDCMIGEGEAPLCHGGDRCIGKQSASSENRDVGREGRISGHRGSEVFSARRGNVHIIGVDGDVVVKRGKEEGVEQFLGNAGGSGRHCVVRAS